MNHKPTYSIREALLPIWQRVLKRTSIRPTDDFFDLGGTPSSAVSLFAEISDAFGRDFPPVMICAARTVETLAGLLEEPAPPRIPSLVLLKSGTEHPPVFIAHGMGGDVLGLSELVGKVDSLHPIYGMQDRGIDGIGEPLPSIEERAQFHLDGIRQLQPHGPYFLIGYSLGGLTTLEIAQRLSADGERIALLALLDTYPDKRHLSMAQRALLSFHRTKRGIASRIESGLGRRRSQSLENDGKSQRYLQSGSIAQVTQRMRGADYSASRAYRPRFYNGRVKFVRAETSHFPNDPTAVWARLVKEFEVETTPGDHVGMLTTHCHALSSVLSRYLRESAAQGGE